MNSIGNRLQVLVNATNVAVVDVFILTNPYGTNTRAIMTHHLPSFLSSVPEWSLLFTDLLNLKIETIMHICVYVCLT
jgi:hypothetical protein